MASLQKLESKNFTQVKFLQQFWQNRNSQIFLFFSSHQFNLLRFKTSYNKGSQPPSLEGNPAHVIGGWFQHSHKGNAFKDPYVWLASNQVPLNNTVFSYTTNLLTIHFTWELICLIGILLMFILVYCNENSIFQTMNKCIPVVLQWLYQSTGSASKRDFIQYVCFSVLLTPHVRGSATKRECSCNTSRVELVMGRTAEVSRWFQAQELSVSENTFRKTKELCLVLVEHNTRLSLLMVLYRNYEDTCCFSWAPTAQILDVKQGPFYKNTEFTYCFLSGQQSCQIFSYTEKHWWLSCVIKTTEHLEDFT